MKSTLQLAKERFGRLDVNVNCAEFVIRSKVFGSMFQTPHDLSQFSRLLEVCQIMVSVCVSVQIVAQIVLEGKFVFNAAFMPLIG